MGLQESDTTLQLNHCHQKQRRDTHRCPLNIEPTFRWTATWTIILAVWARPEGPATQHLLVIHPPISLLPSPCPPGKTASHCPELTQSLTPGRLSFHAKQTQKGLLEALERFLVTVAAGNQAAAPQRSIPGWGWLLEEPSVSRLWRELRIVCKMTSKSHPGLPGN